MLRHSSSSVAAIQPCCKPLASSRIALHYNSMSFVASFNARHRFKLLSTCREYNIPTSSFRKSIQHPSAPLFTIRCSSTTFLKDKNIEFAVYNESAQFDTLSATVRILKQGFFDMSSRALDELLGKKVKMFLVSLDIDPVTKEAKRSSESNLKFARRRDSCTIDARELEKGESYITVLFTVPKDFGRPGAILIESQHPYEFFLKSISLDLPDDSNVYFPCHSWIVESKLNFGQPRVFFANQSYLPNETPPALLKYRHEDLIALRNDGKLQGERKYGERIYDYDVYNDLGCPDKDKKLTRTVLGGSMEFPYPRRCRTGRKRTKNDPEAEQPVGLDDNYLPRDERFSSKKRDLFLAAGVRCLGHKVLPALQHFLDQNRAFETLEQIHDLYVGKLRAVATDVISILRDPGNGTVTNFPPPGVVAANTEAWRSDEEFGRQRLAGANPMVIERLKVFPPVSRLDEEIYGPATSSITERHLERYLGCLTVEEAMEQKRLYVVDFHDIFMPFVNRVNKLKGKMYASRTILFVTEEGVLVPIAIELTLPPQRRGEKAVSRVITPSKRPGVTDWVWQLAKTHVASADCAVHQLSSHWLRSHAVIEPFIIAARRHMSTMHPLHVLLSPHFRDTMHINAMARASLLHSDDLIEKLFTPGMYCGEISSVAYKDWRFDEQALPKDLLKRGVVEEDPTAKHGLRLTIQDYPFAEDALDMWAAIRCWVSEYTAIYYKDDKAVQRDTELQSWWSEATNVGHADKACAEWWGEMRTREAVVEAGTILIWLASGHHASLNFGQYAYAGFMPNYPSMTRQLIPEEKTVEYARMHANPEKFFLETISTQGQATLAMATTEILAQHMSDEVYLGERNDSQWTADSRALAALHNFRRNLVALESDIEARNATEQHQFHRAGSVLLPYTLLSPSSDHGLTFRGVPNSISM